VLLQVCSDALQRSSIVTQMLLAASLMLDLTLFGLILVVLVPLFLVARSAMVVMSFVIFTAYLVLAGFVLKKITKWTKTKAGVVKIFRWMLYRM